MLELRNPYCGRCWSSLRLLFCLVCVSEHLQERRQASQSVLLSSLGFACEEFLDVAQR